MRRPVIGIISAKHQQSYILSYFETTAHYIEEVRRAGGIPMQIPVMPEMGDEDLDVLISRCDGFLLPGGGDFDADWYGEVLLPNLSPDSSAIDRGSQETALRLVRRMADSGKPVLGICLGVQVMTVAFGGNLWQDIPTQLPSAVSHRMPAKRTEDRWQFAHLVTTEEGSLLRSLTGTGYPVNSFHHQAVKTPAPGFRVTARSEDGLIEAVERGNLLGVQWHPENLSHAGQPQAMALFRWLTETAGK